MRTENAASISSNDDISEANLLIRKGLRDVEAGRLISHEEIKEKIEKQRQLRQQK